VSCSVEQLVIALPVLIFSVVVHEYAHGWMALREGDQTAAMLGRLTLNPVPHIDPLGSIIVPALMVMLPGGAILGWAKPVPVNPRNFRNYRQGDIRVSLAGVAANLALAVICVLILMVALVLSVMLPDLGGVMGTFRAMAEYGILINLILIVFNLLPVPPLDGSHVVYHLLPPELGARYREIAPYGLFILLGLLFLGALRYLLFPAFVAFAWMRQAAFAMAGLFV